MQTNTPSNAPQKEEKENWWDIAKFAFTLLLIVVPLRMFVAQPFVVSGLSMFPTFNDKDYLIVDELSYHFRAPSRGEVVIFHPPENHKTYYIKRVIGLPNETVRVENGTVLITNKTHPEGFTLDQSFITYSGTGTSEKTLGPDEYFVMGDNRPASYDSRFWTVNLKRDEIVGRAFLRLFPPKSIDVFPGAHPLPQ